MQYEQFLSAWNYALRESRLRTIGVHPEERLDTRNLDREYKVYLEPLGGQDAEPFTVTAAVWFRWDALNTARVSTTEEDMLTILLGHVDAGLVQTEPPNIRIDIELHATLPWGTTLPLPPRQAWASWVEEVTRRLDDIEPLMPR